MSNYTLTSPIQATQVNLFPSGSANAVTVKAPAALSTNTIFPLPATAGSTGQYLAYNASGATWTSSSGNRSQLPLSTIFYGGGGGFSNSTALTSTNVGSLYFVGTAAAGTPSAIYAIVGGVAGTGVRVRIFDFTNSVQIGISASLTTTATQVIINIPITGSFSASPAILNFQLSRSGGGTARMYFIQFVP
jgi:hypothetical protein